MTDPMTAILYITSDHQHMEELKLAIHFREVAEAPAHEQHVLAMHKHGNKLGGLEHRRHSQQRRVAIIRRLGPLI